MYFKGVRFTNWKCYKGEHEIELKPIVYSVVARHEGNSGRSNWAGKSSFVEGLVWLLTGGKNDDVEVLDDLIHHEEKEMVVEGSLSDGSFIARSKKRGKSAILEVTTVDGKDLMGDGAQEYIDSNVVNTSLFNVINYIEQTKASAIIKTKDTTFSKNMNMWFGIEKVADACAYAAVNFKRLSERERSIRAQMAMLVIEDEQELAVTRDELNEMLGTKLLQIEELRGFANDSWVYDELSGKNDEYLGVDKELKRIDGKTFAVVDDSKIRNAERAVADCRMEWKNSDADLKKLAVLKRGEFDGVCPVAGIECPAKEQINSDIAGATKRFEKQQKAVTENKQLLTDAEQVVYDLSLAKGKADAALVETEKLKIKLKILKPYHEKFLKASAPDEEKLNDLEVLKRDVEDLRRDLFQCDQDIKNSKQARKDKEELTQELAGVIKLMNAWRETTELLGKNGAQRVIAENYIDIIAGDANDILDEMGTGLSVKCRWESEGQKLAEVCDECGTPFPTSARAKECDACGAQRGKKTTFKPRLRISDISGGSKAMGGSVFQLSLGAWLRNAYDVRLGVVFVDEPFESLDAVNAQELGRQILNALGTGFGFEQAFVIAHQQSILESAPGRIQIERANGQSTIQVRH